MTDEYVTVNNFVSYIGRPKNKYEQITSSIIFILDNPAHFNALRFIQKRLDACALKMFKDNFCSGYHPFVIRSAMRELDDKGYIIYDEKPYDMR